MSELDKVLPILDAYKYVWRGEDGMVCAAQRRADVVNIVHWLRQFADLASNPSSVAAFRWAADALERMLNSEEISSEKKGSE